MKIVQLVVYSRGGHFFKQSRWSESKFLEIHKRTCVQCIAVHRMFKYINLKLCWLTAEEERMLIEELKL